MIRTLSILAILTLAATGCSDSTQVSDDLTASQGDASNPTGRTARVDSEPGARAVRIGEGGPRFDACQAVGKVADLRSAQLDVLIAPFDSAAKKDALDLGEMVYICSRSHDQQWFGIVYDNTTASDAAGAGDCGVSSPVRTKQNYDGPCKSGWVESNFVKLVAG